MTNELLGALDGPVFLANYTERTTNATDYYQRPGNIVRKVRGWKCRNVSGLMSEFGAAFQFFDGFGENWHALEECLCYLDEWLPGEGYVVVVERADELLCDAPLALRWFVAVMIRVARWWASPIVDNGRYNRPAHPFQVVLELVDNEASLTQRLEQAGAVITSLSA